jgi:hypothetical protein
MTINSDISERREAFLEDTLAYFSVDPEKRRCTRNNDGTGFCSYSPATVQKTETSEGCAIGRHLPPELQLELDEVQGTVGNLEVWLLIPAELKELGRDFLADVQLLHDTSRHWTAGGLSDSGKQYVEEIRMDYFCREDSTI